MGQNHLQNTGAMCLCTRHDSCLFTFPPSFPAAPGRPCSPGGPGEPGCPRSPLGPVSPVGPCRGQQRRVLPLRFGIFMLQIVYFEPMLQ